MQRIGVMFVDWALFDRARNDLVVDTDSMYGGLVARAATADSGAETLADGPVAASLPAHRAIFVQGPEVNHFRYFRDEVQRDGVPLPVALAAWLRADALADKEPALAAWAPLALPVIDPALATRASRGEPEPASRAVPRGVGSNAAAIAVGDPPTCGPGRVGPLDRLDRRTCFQGWLFRPERIDPGDAQGHRPDAGRLSAAASTIAWVQSSRARDKTPASRLIILSFADR